MSQEQALSSQSLSDKRISDAELMGNFDHGLTLALSKGRILKETLPLLADAESLLVLRTARASSVR